MKTRSDLVEELHSHLREAQKAKTALRGDGTFIKNNYLVFPMEVLEDLYKSDNLLADCYTFLCNLVEEEVCEHCKFPINSAEGACFYCQNKKE